MFKTTEAYVTDNSLFVFVPLKNGGYEAYVNFDSIVSGMPSRVDTSKVENSQLDAKIELLNYLRSKRDRK